MTHIALDAMGGDHAPQATLTGALEALARHDDLRVTLVGDPAVLASGLAGRGEAFEEAGRLRRVPATQVIDMGEHPTKAFAAKPDSSIAVGFGLLAAGRVDGFCSAGNTGAMLVGSMFSVKAVEGVLRPAIAGFVPKTDGGVGVMMDVGANADCKPEHLAQFGELGSLYAKHVLGIDTPKVGLMNLGEEEQKGTLLTLPAYALLKQNPHLNFVGNLEGRDMFNDRADVIVCDGFTGNVILKLSESIYEIMVERDYQADGFFSRLNYEEIGGSPIVGVNGTVVIGHGVSSPKAICNMIIQTARIAQSGLHERIAASLSDLATRTGQPANA